MTQVRTARPYLGEARAPATVANKDQVGGAMAMMMAKHDDGGTTVIAAAGSYNAPGAGGSPAQLAV